MKAFTSSIAVLLASAVVAVASPLYPTATESTWSVKSGTQSVATVTLLADATRARAEWTPASGQAVTMIGVDRKIWVKATGGDLEFGKWGGANAVEKLVLPALLLPVTTSANDKVQSSGGKVASYAYGSTTAAYTHDAKGPASITVTSGGKSWTLTRKDAAKAAKLDPIAFEVRPKQGMSSRLARAAGGLLGPSDSSVSATAGGRGVEKGAKFADGGDYDALEKLETRDEEWQESLPESLEKFQKEGKVGEFKEQE